MSLLLALLIPKARLRDHMPQKKLCKKDTCPLKHTIADAYRLLCPRKTALNKQRERKSAS